MPWEVFRVFDVAKKDQIAQAIHLGIRPENVHRAFHIARGKGAAHVAQHFLEDGSHVRQVARVLRIDPLTRGLRAAGKAEEEIANALQSDHDFHASQ